MSKVTLTTQLDKQLLADAQALIDAGQFNSMDEVLDAALRRFMQNHDAAQHQAAESLAARTVQGLMAEFDPLEREQFEEFVAAYVGVAQQVINDDDMVNLLEIFKAYGFKHAFAAMHEVQDSRVPMSPRYLEMMLGRAAFDNDGIANEMPLSVDVSVQDELDPILAAVTEMYLKEQDRFGPLTELVAEQLKDKVDEYRDLKRWQHGFIQAAIHNRSKLSYVFTCVKNYNEDKAGYYQKARSERGISKSEQHREEKRRRIKSYNDYWDEKLKAKQKSSNHK